MTAIEAEEGRSVTLILAIPLIKIQIVNHRSCFAFFLTRAVKTHFGTGLKSLDLNKGVGVPLEYEIRLWTGHKRNAGLKI